MVTGISNLQNPISGYIGKECVETIFRFTAGRPFSALSFKGGFNDRLMVNIKQFKIADSQKEGKLQNDPIIKEESLEPCAASTEQN